MKGETIMIKGKPRGIIYTAVGVGAPILKLQGVERRGTVALVLSGLLSLWNSVVHCAVSIVFASTTADTRVPVMAGTGLSGQKSVIAVAMPIATAFNFCIRHRKIGLLDR
jgi:hypothetical protein